MINAEIECKKSLRPVSRKCYLNREWTHMVIPSLWEIWRYILHYVKVNHPTSISSLDHTKLMSGSSREIVGNYVEN